jgi:predicted MFS family arabinose efflux permease
MVISDLVRAVLMGVLALVAATSGSAGVAVVVSFLATAAGTAYLPCVARGLPEMVGERHLAAANSVSSTVQNVAVVIGPAIGGLVLLLGSTTWAFAINAVTFLASAVVLRGIHPIPGAGSLEGTGLRAQLAGGWNVLRTSRAARWLTATQMMGAAAYGLVTVFFVLIPAELLGTGSSGTGPLYAAVGVGGVAIAGVTTRMADSPRPSVWLVVAMAMSGLPLAALALAGSMGPALVIVAVLGAALVVGDVVAMTVLQRSLPPDAIGRVFGIADALTVLAMVVGSAAAPAVVDGLGLEEALIATGLAIAVLSLIALPPLLSLDRAAEARRLELEPHVRVLEALAIFDGTTRRGLESMAVSAVREHVTAGTDVVREGDPATAFFVVVEGQLSVRARGEHDETRLVNTLCAGDAFGEIGLIAQLPRTATVSASTDCVLDRISGDAFIVAVQADDHARATFLRRAQVALASSHPSKVDAIGGEP